jgi:hypothetical protein
MSTSPITGLPPAGLTGTHEVQQVSPDTRKGDAVSPAAGADDAVSVDVAAGSPPPEVLEAIAGAAAAYDQLAAQGLHVSVDSDPAGGRLNLQLQDHDGKVLSQLKPSEVLALADGNAPDQTRKSTDVHQQRQPDQ